MRRHVPGQAVERIRESPRRRSGSEPLARRVSKQTPCQRWSGSEGYEDTKPAPLCIIAFINNDIIIMRDPDTP